MSDLFHVGHVAQLHEIQRARKKRNLPGVGRQVEELIRSLTEGGVSQSVGSIARTQACRTQAKRLFQLGFGSWLGFETEDDYLSTIPDIPKHMLGDDTEFPFLVLVDQRLGLTKTCELANIIFHGDDTFVPWGKKYVEPTEPHWIRMQDGRRYHSVSPRDCRKRFANDERGLTAFQGVAAFIQHPDIIKQGEHGMDLPGSVDSDNHDCTTYLGMWEDRPELLWRSHGSAFPDHGSASRRVYKEEEK